ncbi:carbohydrate ABC transporter permease [Breznakiella homolactica]|uniref:Carbohydrate ABC transporter permease n=1 Tax=Breznakiella homolactica TaxID=2798577 RepID=A0A7T7XK61_9SPIR|nr:carbohydrate ABC transporter permease [Breznakiella homolactica]QQO07737.1 carbohydrate ABC transporter permease [Breznakiella homolactica]
MEKKSVIGRILTYTAVVLSSIIMAFPFLWMLSASFKDDLDVFVFPIQWIPETFKFENYSYIWNKAHYPILFGNTLFLAVTITILQIITCSMAAYAFSKIIFPERNKLFLAYLATLMIPMQAIMIPQFMIIRSMGLANTRMALILTQAFNPMGVFLLRQYYQGIPNELSEAARIDGLTEFGIYSRVVLPLAKPAVASLTIFTSVAVWNDFLPPLIYINSPSKYTIQLGLRNLISEFSAEYAPIMAASVISLIPILILFLTCQKFFVEGAATTGLKG